jgi:hypothetical protein
MPERKVLTFRVHVTDWNGEEKTQTHTPQNFKRDTTPEKYKAWLQKQWPNATIHDVSEISAVVDEEAFTADPSSPAAKPRVVESAQA